MSRESRLLRMSAVASATDFTGDRFGRLVKKYYRGGLRDLDDAQGREIAYVLKALDAALNVKQVESLASYVEQWVYDHEIQPDPEAWLREKIRRKTAHAAEALESLLELFTTNHTEDRVAACALDALRNQVQAALDAIDEPHLLELADILLGALKTQDRGIYQPHCAPGTPHHEQPASAGVPVQVG